MNRSDKLHTRLQDRRDAAGRMAPMTERLGLATVAAAWPVGVSQLAQAIGACQRNETGQVRTDWLAHASDSIVLPPVFCANRRVRAR
jgi:hypothetical protein